MSTRQSKVTSIDYEPRRRSLLFGAFLALLIATGAYVRSAAVALLPNHSNASKQIVQTRRSFMEPSPLHILSGSFVSLDLYLFRFRPPTPSSPASLDLVRTIDAQGPHQYLGINEARDRVYATSWALPPRLSAWKVERTTAGDAGDVPNVSFINEVPITATSSYTTVVDNAVLSVGGPTGEVHRIDSFSGELGKKLQELLYVPEDRLEAEDKTRKALRYGSHAIEVSSRNQVFVPHLGDNAIYVYSFDRQTSRLTQLGSVPSPREHDGPRHVVVSSDGETLYSVTEHTQFVDVFTTSPSPPYLAHRTSHSLLPSSASPSSYRGDTIRLSPHTSTLFATTRGATPNTKGFLVAWDLDSSGSPVQESAVRWETPTSGGKANAIELLPGERGRSKEGEEWIVLTDDEEGWVFVVGWRKVGKERGFREVARCRVAQKGGGTSHAVWLG